MTTCYDGSEDYMKGWKAGYDAALDEGEYYDAPEPTMAGVAFKWWGRATHRIRSAWYTLDWRWWRLRRRLGLARAGPLQRMIDATVPGDTLAPPSADYREHVAVPDDIRLQLEGSRIKSVEVVKAERRR